MTLCRYKSNICNIVCELSNAVYKQTGGSIFKAGSGVKVEIMQVQLELIMSRNFL